MIVRFDPKRKNANKFKDITGQRFGKLVAIEPTTKNKKGAWNWLCKCDCGKEKIVGGCCLRNGNTKSCGCLAIALTKERETKHGLSSTKLYEVHQKMLDRCINEDNPGFHNYGGRGIKVCKEWLVLKNFYNWSINNGYLEGLTIDRVDNDGNYCPENCRWVTRKEYSNNTRSNHPITFKGETKTLTQWAESEGLTRSALKYRLAHDWSIEEALTRPLHKTKGALL